MHDFAATGRNVDAAVESGGPPDYVGGLPSIDSGNDAGAATNPNGWTGKHRSDMLSRG